MEGVTFTMRDMKRYSVVKAAMEGRMTNREGAAAIVRSIRQFQRIKKKVKKQGMAGVRHGNCGRPPAHTFPGKFKKQVITLAQRRYKDFNFSHMAEMLEEEEEIHINRETLRLWLRPLGFGGKARRQRRHRKRRERAERMGQLLFLDGSPHVWFGTKQSTLLLCTDDATGEPLHGLFRDQEDLDGCFAVCQEVFTHYGLPVRFYLDRASQFTTTRRGGLHVIQQDGQPTQFERAMSELGIRLIFADSPEARGRAERINGTFQDRLVAELGLRRIKTAAAATAYLNRHFIPRYAKRFGVTPQEKVPAWRPCSRNLRNILCRRFQRTVNNDNTVSVNGHIIQIHPLRTRFSFVKARVTVNLWLDGSWHVLHERYGELFCHELLTASQRASNSRSKGMTYSRCTKDDIFMLR